VLEASPSGVSGSGDTTLAFWKEHREQLRQSETQRSTLTNFLLVVTAGLSALIVQQKFAAPMIALSIFICVLGMYGALTVAKYYERAAYHLRQARALAEVLVSLGALGSDELLEVKRVEHYKQFAILRRLRLHHLWVALHIFVALYGIVLTVICIAQS
jgi:hypothetical protein